MYVRSWRCATLAVTLAAIATPGAQASSEPLDAYRVDASKASLDKLAKAGFDVTEARRGGRVEIAATTAQAAKLRAQGLEPTRVETDQGVTPAERSAERTEQSRAEVSKVVGDDSAFSVYRKYDAVAGDGREQITERYDRLLAEHPGILAKTVMGTSTQGREIIALQVTKDATGAPVANRPAVAYTAVQHAREWLAGQTCLRTIDWFVTNYGKDTEAGRTATALVDQTELWFQCISNPDGYEYTFTEGNRLWRKNLHDNDGDGQLTAEDGVDPNRNFPTNWGRDDEGSSSTPSSETFRGTAPASEPETQAMMKLLATTKPAFQKNDHTAAELLLYPQGFQQDTLTADHAIFIGLAGDDDLPAIADEDLKFDPDLGAELYITNGDTNDYAYREQDVLSYTPEGAEATDPDVSAFEFEDDEAAIAQEFQRHLAFSLDLAEAAQDPVEIPGNQFGATTPDFVVDTFPESYGDPQPVQATVKRKLGPVTMHWSVDDGPEKTAPTEEFRGGVGPKAYYVDDAVHYHRVRGEVRGTKPGDRVEVWFTAAGKASKRFTYTARSATKDPVLVLADEDYTGLSPAQDGGPSALSAYTKALRELKVDHDVYDVDAAGRRAPDPLGVLSHYEAVVWETGQDVITREQGQVPGSMSKLAVETQNNVRDYLNEGGKLLYQGKYAGLQFAQGYAYDPEQGAGDPPCTDVAGADDGALSECIRVQDDFLQYWLGAYLYSDEGGSLTDEEGNVTGSYPVAGTSGPFTGLELPFGGPESADDVDHTATLLTTSSILDPARFPLWADSRGLAQFVRPSGAPYEPYTGEKFAAAGADDASYKRLTRTVDLTGATAGELAFRTSFDLEPDYDYLFVEARTAGGDDWTTLAEKNGHTTTDTGLSCPTTSPGSDWQSLHPFLARYQTKGGEECTSTGTSGAWNAATGNSSGWQDWAFDLSAYAGKQVELSITVATDPAALGLGVWLDDAKVTVGGATVAETSFEDGLGGFTAGSIPEGTESQLTGWQSTVTEFEEGPVVGTDRTVYATFGLQSIAGAAKRAAFMKAAMDHLGVKAKEVKPKPAAGDGGGGPAAPAAGAEPVAAAGDPPAATPPARRPGVRRASLVRRMRIATALRKGVPITIACGGPCTASLEASVSSATKRGLKLGGSKLVRRSVKLADARSKKVTLRFSRATAARLRKAKRNVTLTVATRVAGANADRSSVARRVTLTR